MSKHDDKRHADALAFAVQFFENYGLSHLEYGEPWTGIELAEALRTFAPSHERRSGPVDRRANDPLAPNAPYRRMAAGRRAGDAERRTALLSPPSTTRQSVPADWQTGAFKAWKEQPGHEHAPWFLVTPNGCALRMGYHNDDAEDQRQAEWLASACNAALGAAPDLTAYPNLQAVLRGTVSGHHTEWPMVRAELHKLLAAFTPSATPRSEIVEECIQAVYAESARLRSFSMRPNDGPDNEARGAMGCSHALRALLRRPDGGKA